MSTLNKEFRNDLKPGEDFKHKFKEQTKFAEKLSAAEILGWLKTVFQPEESVMKKFQVTIEEVCITGDYWYRLWPVSHSNILLELGLGDDDIVGEWFLIDNDNERLQRVERTVYQVSGPGFELPKLTRGQYSYPNAGHGKVNNVEDKDLSNHIAYNLIFRPGRSFLLNGVIVYKGIGFNAEECDKFAEDYKNNPPVMTRATVPYC